MNNHSETKNTDRTQFETLFLSFSHQQAIAKEQTTEISRLQNEVSSMEASYGITVLADMRSVTGHLDELACAIRHELGLDAKLDDFQKQTFELQFQMAAALKDLRDYAASRTFPPS